jgi:GntR family transcriptional repressor for pyruvate dehydrogenase complex
MRRTERVFEQLRAKILTGAFAAGVRLPNERELSEVLRVNRGSVREALKRLEFLELIEVRHGQGSFVRDVTGSSALQIIDALMRDRSTVTTELLRQLLEFRHHITCHVVELATRNWREEHMERARALLDEEAASESDPSTALSLDVAMNSLLGEATGNLMYQLLTNLFTKLITRLGPIYYNEQRDHRRSLATHRELLAAMADRDPERARAILEVMLDYSEQAILAEAERLEAEGLIGPGAPSADS